MMGRFLMLVAAFVVTLSGATFAGVHERRIEQGSDRGGIRVAPVCAHLQKTNLAFPLRILSAIPVTQLVPLRH